MYQDVYEFYDKCTVPFKTIGDLKIYHNTCAPCVGIWPDVDAIYCDKTNKSIEAVKFRRKCGRLTNNNCDDIMIDIQERNSKVPGEPLYEYIGELLFQDAFDFYDKCTMPFKTIGDLNEYHEKSVRQGMGKRWPYPHMIVKSPNTSPEAVAFKKMFNRLIRKFKLDWDAKYHTVKESVSITPAAPVTPAVPLTPVRYVFSSRRPPVASGNFVYYIQTEFYRVSKVGKHSGMLSQMVSEIGYTEAFDVIAYDCGKYDYSKVEKSVLSIMDAREFLVFRNQVVNDVGKFFDDTLRVLLG